MRKKQSKLNIAKRKVELAMFDLFDFICTKFEKLKKQKKNSIFPFVFFLFLFFANNAHASIVADIVQNGTNGNSGNVTLIGQSFTAVRNNVQAFDILPVAGAGAGNTTEFYFCKGSSTNFAVDYNCSGQGMTFIASTTFTGSNNNVSYIQLPLPKYTVIGDKYFIAMKSLNNTSWGWLTTNAYTSGAVLPTTLNQSADIYFRVYGETTYDPAYIVINSPTNGQRFVNQSIPLTVTVFNPNLAYNGAVITILNKQNFTALNDLVFDVSVATATATFDLSISDFPDGNYRLSGYMYDRNTGIRSTTSNIVNFVTGSTTIFMNGDQQYINTGQLSESQICGNIATSTFFGGVECGLKKTVAWSIYPSQSTIDDLKNSYTGFKQSFPFNAYFQLTDTINTAISSTSLSRNGTFDVPMIDKQGHIGTIPILSSSSMAKTVGQSNSNLIRNSITWFMWLCVAFLIFLQFKKI